MDYYLARLRLGDEWLPNWVWVIRLPETGIFDATITIQKVVREAMGHDWDALPDATDVVVERLVFKDNIAEVRDETI